MYNDWFYSIFYVSSTWGGDIVQELISNRRIHVAGMEDAAGQRGFVVLLCKYKCTSECLKLIR